MVMRICKGCKKSKIIHAKGFCDACYVKNWRETATRIKYKCPNCKRLKIIHAKGLCINCYRLIHRYDKHLDNVHKRKARKYFNLTLKEYQELTKKCVICGFDKIICLHHKDRNKKNNSKENFVGLCPNHHFMAHNIKYKKEIEEKLLKIR